MNKPMKIITLGFIFALMTIVINAPMTAQAGTLTIYNKNCTTLKVLKKVKRVTVHVFDDWFIKCTDKKVTVGIGQSKTITLKETGYTTKGRWKACRYSAEPMGTSEGPSGLPGDEDLHITCKKGGLWCGCFKD